MSSTEDLRTVLTGERDPTQGHQVTLPSSRRAVLLASSEDFTEVYLDNGIEVDLYTASLEAQGMVDVKSPTAFVPLPGHWPPLVAGPPPTDGRCGQCRIDRAHAEVHTSVAMKDLTAYLDLMANVARTEEPLDLGAGRTFWRGHVNARGEAVLQFVHPLTAHGNSGYNGDRFDWCFDVVGTLDVGLPRPFGATVFEHMAVANAMPRSEPREPLWDGVHWREHAKQHWRVDSSPVPAPELRDWLARTAAAARYRPEGLGFAHEWTQDGFRRRTFVHVLHSDGAPCLQGVPVTPVPGTVSMLCWHRTAEPMATEPAARSTDTGGASTSLPDATPVGGQSVSSNMGHGSVAYTATSATLDEVVRLLTEIHGAPEQRTEVTVKWRSMTGTSSTWVDVWALGYGGGPGFDPALVPEGARTIVGEGSFSG
jgi:hypothetical protein